MPEVLVDAFVHACFTVVYLSLIPLSASMSVGLVLGVLQAVTQIQEQSLTFVAKLVAASTAIYLTRGYWIAELSDCFQYSFEALVRV